ESRAYQDDPMVQHLLGLKRLPDVATISRMLVAGGGAKLRGLPEAIGDALGIKVELGDPWLSVAVDENRFDTHYLRNVAAEFAVPLGLALRGVAGVD
ncbi:MAG TPA: pilus assembly protein PilM, partial [Trueperaceae bacterium]|nr:pilus assembly protein PilM [Trueperaceae bacterium]